MFICWANTISYAPTNFIENCPQFLILWLQFLTLKNNATVVKSYTILTLNDSETTFARDGTVAFILVEHKQSDLPGFTHKTNCISDSDLFYIVATKYVDDDRVYYFHCFVGFQRSSSKKKVTLFTLVVAN